MPNHTPETFALAIANKHGVPDYMIRGFTDYVFRGVPVGGFLTAVFEGDLMGALRAADDTNRRCLSAYASALYNEAPPACYGSKLKHIAWLDSGGLEGIRAKEEAPKTRTFEVTLARIVHYVIRVTTDDMDAGGEPHAYDLAEEAFVNTEDPDTDFDGTEVLLERISCVEVK